MKISVKGLTIAGAVLALLPEESPARASFEEALAKFGAALAAGK